MTTDKPAGTQPVPALFFAGVERRYTQAKGALEILRGALHDIASSGTCIMSATGSMTDHELEALNGDDEPEDDE